MRIVRSSLFTVAVAFAAAACGDKVTVAGPAVTTTTTAVSKVNSVAVAPVSATMNIGDKITLIPSVNADAGLATTVTWSSSDATKASVDGSGVVTAVAATPGVAVCATSTVDTGKKGCASIIVTSAPISIPATVSIAGITQTNLNTPVDPSNTNGLINVQANINTGNATVQRVVLVVDGQRVDSQVISAAQSAALRSAADESDRDAGEPPDDRVQRQHRWLQHDDGRSELPQRRRQVGRG